MLIFSCLYNSFKFFNNRYNWLAIPKSLTTQTRDCSTNKEIVSKTSTLNPWWVTGFVDAEGCFSMSIFKSKTAAIGWTVEPCFIITLHVRDLELLNSIKQFFSAGSVSIVGKDARFRVRSRSELKVIIAHFNKYPLQTSKALNFSYFCEILSLINKKAHTNIPTKWVFKISFFNK